MGTMRGRLARNAVPTDFAAPLRALGPASERVETAARIFYAFPLFWLATHLHLLRPLLEAEHFRFVWSVAWIGLVGPELGVPMVLGFAFLTAMLGALAPEYRALRIAVFLGLFQTLGVLFSFGKIHHLMHATLFTAFVFAVFLPDAAFRARHAQRAERQHALLAFHAAQTMLALTYSLAGVGKLLGSAYQLAQGQITPLHPEALARHIADRLLQTHPESLLGDLMIEYGALLWPMMLATLYLQLFALVAVFRPRLHRLWGLGLMSFHTVTGLTMTIDFTPNILLLGILYLASPFAPSGWDLRGMLSDLPLLGKPADRLLPPSASRPGQ